MSPDMREREPERVIYTVGHSTRSADDTLKILAAGSVKLIADVRRFPGSRRFTQFNQDSMTQWLADAGIDYRHFPDLGGRRSQRLPDSPNHAWRVEAFNAYADYMQAAGFIVSLNQLMEVGLATPTANMCSEALPHKCHRRLISDYLLVRGWQVRHLLSPKRIDDHQLTPFAKVEGTTVTYPSELLF
jgi:uncharacterized protein (DUF488 family)